MVDDEPYRCLYYREHVHGRKDLFAPRFFDPRWLALPNGHFFLSALTTLPDDAVVTFRIYDTEDGIELGSTLSAELSGIVKLGVAMVVWAPDGSEPGKPPPAAHRPAFRVTDDQVRAEATKPWPLTGPAHVLIDSTTNALRDLDLRFRLRATDGTYEQERHVSEAVPYSTHHVQLEFTDVPIESRFILEYDEAGGTDFDSTYFEDVVLAGLRGQCESGSQCTEPDPPEPPPPSSPAASDVGFDDDYEDAGEVRSPGDDGYGMEWDPEE